MKKISRANQADGSYAIVYHSDEQKKFVVQFFDHRGTHMDASDEWTNDDSNKSMLTAMGWANPSHDYDI